MNAKKLRQIANLLNEPLDEILEAAVLDDIVHGICINPDCEFITEVGKYDSEVECEACNTPTVSSVLVLAGEIE